jgi:hypothetical protein
MTWRFLKTSSVHGTCNPGTVGCLLICEFFIDPIVPFETAARKVLA